MENKKKPWYKKWWVWLIIVLVLMLLTPTEDSDTTSSDNTESTTTNEKETTTKEAQVKEEATTDTLKKASKVELKVNSVEQRTLTQTESMLADEGNKIMDVHFTIENKGVTDGLEMNPLYFTAETDTLSGINPTAIVTNEDGPDTGSKLKEGIAKDYTVSFGIPQDENITQLKYKALGNSATAEIN